MPPHPAPATTRARRSIAIASGIALIASLPVAVAGAQTSDPTHTLRAAGTITAGSRDMSTIAATAQADKAVRVPGNVKLYQTRHSLLGLHRWYRQYHGGHVVVGGWWGWHRDRRTGHITIWDGRKDVGKVNVETPALGINTASRVAAKTSTTIPADVTHQQVMVLPATATHESRLVWAISSADGRGARTSYVDAVTGAVLKMTIDSKFSHSHKVRFGRARVFDPNPVQKLQDESVRDNHDSREAVPPRAYSKRTLRHLTGNGHSLVGLWVTIVNKDLATSKTRSYMFNRSNPHFEQTNAYYAMDAEQFFLRRLGFDDVNAESQDVHTNAFKADNSFFDNNTDMISSGTGGVDDAEDPEVMWHEYGHAIQFDQIPAWGRTHEGSSIGEAFGDYMAVTMSQRFGADTTITPLACVMDWDATSYTSRQPHCLRRTDEDKIYPDDLDPNKDPHIDGEIWSRALWDINQAIGRNRATTITIESQFWMNPQIRFTSAALVMIDTAERLYRHDNTVSTAVYQAFADRGILPAA